MSQIQKHILITGAGLVGSLLSIYLRRKGYTVSIYERRGDMRKEAVEAGRSINLALSDRGIKALREVGIADEVLQIAIPMHGRHLHQPNGTHAFQPYGKEGQYINSVSRRELNCKLMDLAEREGVTLHFDHQCTGVDWKANRIAFATPAGAVSQPFDLLFGADGAYSATRLAHMLQHQKFDYEQYYIDCGYKELAIPAGAGGSFLLEKNALHIWPRGNYMLIALPNLDGTFTGTLFFPFEGETSFEKLTTPESVETFFQNTFPDLVPLVPDLTQQFFHNPTSALVTVKCFPWIREDRFALLGDAAHAIVPFFGQGMNAGFEDCSVLAELIGQHGDDWGRILEEFQELRKPDADAIADLAVNNFTEMRERTADPKFLLQKKIEAWLHEQHPDQWIPAYSQVTFSPQIRYSEALRNSRRQEAIMQQVMQEPGIEENWKTDDVKARILRAKVEGIG
ncbi:MAG: FAD-dependent monooxygenase [Chitinophagaceae bacterium]|nr:MAG: FAD-dependent monooxygenase [Chitinophagaceae bacterium]